MPEPEFQIVVNDEEQYALWPADGQVPPGWRAIGFTGPKADCLHHVTQVWTDMRPLSLRRRLGAAETSDRA
ncbi:MbtH domain protein [Actinobacteria bacterium OK074]|nr:MbtH domain protein [Actinobacteria bacterium OK074]